MFLNINKGLTRNSSVPFTHKDTVVSISSYKLSKGELKILKFGLTFSIKPSHLNKSHVFTTFELLHQYLNRRIEDKSKTDDLGYEVKSSIWQPLMSTLSSLHLIVARCLKEVEETQKEQGHRYFKT